MTNTSRKRIGIVFYDHEHWTGGTYYILNLVSALGRLPAEQQPELIVFTRNDKELSLLRSTGYQFLRSSAEVEALCSPPQYSTIEKAFNKISRTVLGRNVFEKRPRTAVLNAIFPVQDVTGYFPGRDFYYGDYFGLIPKVYWIPDFQEHYLPQFFSEKELQARKAFQASIASMKSDIVFSSRDAEADFRKLFSGSPARTFVLNFAVTHPAYQNLDAEALRSKYALPAEYFFSPNQFWQHKNHITVLKAVAKLKKEGTEVTVAFSGKEEDYRNPDYFGQLKEFVRTNGLEANIRFLGFIDRREQLKLMSGAVAIIQPSLFEGWSTVVEDAKAMDQFVIASELAVHREQLESNAEFFDPGDDSALAAIMKRAYMQRPRVTASGYNENVLKFAEDFLRIMNSVGA
jgi:glycosyltransferase involved in cell wall biosynthesis